MTVAPEDLCLGKEPKRRAVTRSPKSHDRVLRCAGERVSDSGGAPAFVDGRLLVGDQQGVMIARALWIEREDHRDGRADGCPWVVTRSRGSSA